MQILWKARQYCRAFLLPVKDNRQKADYFEIKYKNINKMVKIVCNLNICVVYCMGDMQKIQKYKKTGEKCSPESLKGVLYVSQVRLPVY